MEEEDKRKKRRRVPQIVYALIIACALLTAVSTIAQATNRPLRYYAGDGGTAMTFYANSSGDQNKSLWGINTDNPVCELDINGTVCIDRTGIFYNGVNISGGGGAPSTAQYVTLALDGSLSAERVLTPGKGITVTDTGANGIARINVTGLKDCTGTQASQYNGTEWNCVTGSSDGNNYTTSQAFESSGNNVILQTARNGANNVSAFFTFQSSTGILLNNGAFYANATNCSTGQYSRYENNGWNCYNDASGGSGTVTSIAINSTTPSVSITGSPITTNGIIVLDIANATVFNDGLMTGVQVTSLNSKALAGNCVGENATHINVSVNITTAGVQCYPVSKNPGGGSGFVYSDYFNQVLNQSSNVEFGNVIPNANNTYDLGSTTRYWRDLYVSNGTIHLGPSINITGDATNIYNNGVALMLVNDQRYNDTVVIGALYTNVTSLQLFRDGIYANVTPLQAFRDAIYANVTTIQGLILQLGQNDTNLNASINALTTQTNTINTTVQNIITTNTTIFSYINGLYANTTLLQLFRDAIYVNVTGKGTVNQTNGTAGYPAVFSAANNLVASLIGTNMITLNAINSSLLNTTNTGTSGQVLTLNANLNQFTWATPASGGSGMTEFGISGGGTNRSIINSSTFNLYGSGVSINVSGSGADVGATITVSAGGGNVSGGSINGTSGFVAIWNSTTTVTNSTLFVKASTGQVLTNNYGTEAAPAYSTQQNPDTGWYTDAAGQFMVTCDAVKCFQANADGIQVSQGSATFPGIQSTSDDDTGPYWKSANVFAITAAGNAGGGEVANFSTVGVGVSALCMYPESNPLMPCRGFHDDPESQRRYMVSDMDTFVVGGAETGEYGTWGWLTNTLPTGGDVTPTVVTFDVKTTGVLSLGSGTVTGSNVSLSTDNVGTAGLWVNGSSGILVAYARVAASLTGHTANNYTTMVGFSDVQTKSIGTDAVVAMYNSSESTNWILATCNSGACTKNTSSIKWGNNSFADIEVQIWNDTQARLYVNGTLAATSHTNVPSGSGDVMWAGSIRHGNTNGTTESRLYIDYYGIARIFNEPRY